MRSFRYVAQLSKQLITLALVVLMALSTTPAVTAASLIREAATRSSDATNYVLLNLKGWLSTKNVQQEPPKTTGIRPRPPESRAEKESRVAQLEMNPSGNVVLQSRQPLIFTAIPVDAEGNAVHALQAEWESSDKTVVSIRKSGQAVARRTGNAILTARAGPVSQTVTVTVVQAQEEFGGKKKQDSTRGAAQVGLKFRELNAPRRIENSKTVARIARVKRHHEHASRKTSFGLLSAAMPLRPPNEDPLPDNETNSLYQASNIVGSPLGKTKPGAMTPAAATKGKETNGSQNFTFALPIVGLASRGLDVSLSLVYNSQVWNKSTDPSNNFTWMTYDVDSGWPEAGWRLSLGQIEDQGSFGFTLTDPDGTRHALTYTSANNYDTTDGTFIHFTGGSGWGTVYYPDGTRISYGAAGGGYRSYPTSITDRNGNYIWINYVNGVGPKISSIVDTLLRYIRFYYATNGDLVTIKQPGLTGYSDLQVMRFYYTDVTLGSSLFDSSIHVSGPTSVHTLQYVYLPTSTEGTNPHVGYRFDYSPYGMVRQITQSRGMTVTSTSDTSPGSVSGDGTMAAQTIYYYPTSGQSLTDVPKYPTRTDDWAGRTTGGSAPAYSFATTNGTGEKISSITAPDGTITEIHAIDSAGNWNDGLVTQTIVKYGSTVFSNTVIDWQQTPTAGPPRVADVKVTDDGNPAQTKATVLSYTSYNSVSVVSERDFTTDGSISATELRRTETTYVTSTNYTNRYLLHLPSMVQVFPGGSATPASRIDYAYDNYGTNHANMTARAEIVMHDDTYNPFCLAEGKCEYDCIRWKNDICTQWGWICPYDPSTDYRGNVTSVTTYSDAANTSSAITHATTYDVAGNVTTAQVDCCQQKAFSYTDSPNTHTYAYPTSVTTGPTGGPNLTMSTTYDVNTGLVGTTTDENNQTTTNYYNGDSLRLEHVSYPDGGITSFIYGDGLSADGSGHLHYFVDTRAKLDANRNFDSYQFFDGRGAVARRFKNNTLANGWFTQDMEYDSMGRAYRVSNPYYSTGNDAVVNSTGFWTTNTFDHLGRVTQVTMPRGDDDNSLTTSVLTSYAGVYTTVTDQAGKVRRQKLDALGRVIRLDEPTTSGLGSTSSPNQATNYTYDVLDNLVRINQGGQDRYFKFDSLSRLIRERQVEQITNSSYDLSDPLTGNSSWTRKIDYNSSSLITDAYDARGVHTTISYDGLNRVTTITYSDSTPTAHYYYDSQTLPSGAPSIGSPDYYSRGYSSGRLVAMTYGNGATGTYVGYDNVGQMTQQFQLTGSTPTKYKLSYAYNYAGLLTGETYPSGRAIAHSYDEGGRLAQVSDGSTTFANSFAYAAHGGLTSETWGNTAVHTMSYNRRLQASQVKLAMGSTVQQQYDYGYGEFNASSGAVDTSKNNGQIGKILGTIGTTAQWNQGFSYDELGRISNIAEHQGSTMNTLTYSQGYTYDRYGNRFQSANATLGLPAVTSSEIVAATNRFISNGAYPTTYDAAGNITQDMKFRGMTYSYDANGRMTSAWNFSSSFSSTYDCAGQRVQTTANSLTRTMVYDIFGQDVADYTGTGGGTLETENIYRGGQLLARYNAGTSSLTYVLTDVQGSARTIMNNSGGSSSVIARHDYLPFGEEIASGVGLRSSAQGYGGTDYNRLKYALTERDDVTGLDHTWWRKLESLSGRWTSPDPYNGSFDLGDPQSINRYSYTRSDPVNLIDPTGLLCEIIWVTPTHYIELSDPSCGGGGISGPPIWIRDDGRGGGPGLHQNPKPVSVKQIIANVKNQQAKIDKARKEFEDCVRNNPKVAEARKRVANARADWTPAYEFGSHEVIHFGMAGAGALTAGNIFVVIIALIIGPDIVDADRIRAERELAAVADPVAKECANQINQKYGFTIIGP
jgi:RHS repeat-associated protein